MEMIAQAGHGHPGGGLSLVEILTVLYFHVMRVDPKHPKDQGRDRLVLSKGHGSAAWYAALALRGFFPRSDYAGFRKIFGILQGHPDMRKTPGVDMTSGSLGQGLSNALGMALAARLHKKNYRVYAVLGDGEIQEGIVNNSSSHRSASFRFPNAAQIGARSMKQGTPFNASAEMARASRQPADAGSGVRRNGPKTLDPPRDAVPQPPELNFM